MNKKVLSTQNMALIAIFTALIAVCSWISIPGQVPFTLQTFAVFVTAGLLGYKRGIISIVVYIILGMIGIPVFSGMKAGVSVIVGPTGGYIVGFILTVLIIGIGMKLAENKSKSVKLVITFVSMLLGDVACFLIGTLWFMYITKSGLVFSLLNCVVPFIIPDIVKIAVALIVVDRMKKHLKVFN